MTWFEAVNYTSQYEKTGGESVFSYICPMADSIAMKATLLGALDAHDITLECDRVDIHYYGDPSAHLAEVVAKFRPALIVDAEKPDRPFRWRVEINGHEQKIGLDGGYFWEGNTSKPCINVPGLNPVLRTSLWDVVLYGSRSSVNLATYSSYTNRVNSDSPLGAAAGTLLFTKARISQRQNAGGVVVYDVELPIGYNPIGWNKFWNSEEKAWQTPKDSGGNPLIPGVAMAGLLT